MPQALTTYQRDYKSRWQDAFEREWTPLWNAARTPEERTELTNKRAGMMRQGAARMWRAEDKEVKTTIEQQCSNTHVEQMKAYEALFGSPWAALPNSRAW